MRTLKLLSLLIAVPALLILSGCAGTRPTPYAGLASSPQLRPNQADPSGRVPYRYGANVNWRDYSKVLIEPVSIYSGSDSQFEDVTEQEKEALAQHMEARFQRALAAKFSVVSAPAPGTIRVRATLTGAKSNTRFITTFLRFDIGGGPYNMVQAARDEEGMLTGSVSYAVEISDASNDRLLSAYVSKQFPNAWNIKATLGRMDASKVGIDKAADDLVARLN